MLFVSEDRSYMYGLYGANFRRGALYGPTTTMVFFAAHHDKLKQWLVFLMTRAGTFFSQALSANVPILELPVDPFSQSELFAPILPADVEYCLYSDAASEANEGGLGGWAHGEFWHYSLSEEERRLLHFTAWEFIALAINVIIYGRRLRGLKVYLLADALATIQIVARRAAHSPIMQIIHDLVIALPEYQMIVLHGLQNHVFGELNAPADAASRGRFTLVSTLARQIGVIARRINVPERALDFINLVLDRVRAFRNYEAGLEQPSDLTVRPQSRQELKNMRHLGSSFLGADDNPQMFLPARYKRSMSPPNLPSSPELNAPGLRPYASASYGLARSDRGFSPQVTPILFEQSAIPVRGLRSLSPPCLVPTRPGAVDASFQLSSAREHKDFGFLPATISLAAHYPSGLPCAQQSSRMGKLPPVPSSHVLIDSIFANPGLVAPSPLLQLLRSDPSPLALRPADPHLLEAYVQCVGHTMSHSIPKGSQSHYATSWKYWLRFMAPLNSPPLRLPEQSPVSRTREKVLKAAFILWCKRNCTSTIPGRLTVKPSTCLGHLYGVAKIHELHDIEFSTKGMTKQAIAYLGKEYEYLHGPESLIPRRREGFSRSMLRQMLRSLPGLVVHSKRFPVVSQHSWLERNLKAVLCVSSSGGFRKAEISLAPEEDFNAMHMSRASLFFVLDGVICRCPSKLQLASMKRTDQVGLIACPCKNDPLGLHFVPFPLIFNFNPDDDADTGVVLRDMALHCWVPDSELRSTPLFTYSERKDPFRRDFLDLILRALLRTFLPVLEAELYSWHSFRIGLACSLRAAGAPDWIILALCRWRSTDSIPVYGRVNFAVTAAWIDSAAAQSVSSLQVANLPGVPEPPIAGRPLHSLPSLLPIKVYDYLGAANAVSENLSPSQIQDLSARIPDTDDDAFMFELMREPEPDS